jgi:hypothetical protein
MKNVTISVDEEVARRARVWAAERGMSLSRALGELVREKLDEDRGYRAAMRRDLSRSAVVLKEIGRYPSRDELHER